MKDIVKLQLFGMKNLLLETELVKLENSGINIEHKESLKIDEDVDTDLFELDIMKAAKKMANFYVLYYCIENTIRRLIDQRMAERYGPNWWEKKVPDSLKTEVKKRQEKEKDSPMSIRSENPIIYTTFGELVDIFNSNWTDFSDTIRSQKAMQSVLFQLNQMRAVVAHSAELNEDEIKRFELLIKDWLRIQT